MKKLYLEDFKISNDSKITDKAMLCRVIVTVVVMLVCVTAMSLTAFAFFTAEVSSSTIEIQSAAFDVETKVDGDSIDVIGELSGEHTITLAVKDTSTATTGYCVVNIGGSEYITQQFIRSENGFNTVTFTLKLEKPTDVVVEARWGTSAVYAAAMQNNAPANYIVDQAVIDLVPKAPVQPQQNEISDNLEAEQPITENLEETTEQLEE